ncbi:MAG: glycosyltransferase family 4 protein [Gemmatimonadota bacterium]
MSYSLFFAGFLLSLGLSILLTRWLRGVAPRLGLVDRPDGERHRHAEPIATVGGIAIFLTVAVALMGILGVASLAGDLPPGSRALYPILIGAAAMHLLGVWDDLRDLSARTKFLGQLAISLAVFAGGVRLTTVYVPGLGLLDFALPVSLLLTVLWLLAITNAFNLVDGVDGLAGGAALLATLTMFVASLTYGHQLAALLLVVTAAALLGFLHFNFPPATVFLGDGGSLFLGFLLAGLGLTSSTKAATAVAIAIPVVAFGLPVLDTVLAMTRRFLRGERLSEADRRHIHHRLMELGHSPRKVAIILYGACGAFALASLLLLSEDGRLVGLVFLVVGVALWFGIQQLRIPELLEFRRVIDRGMQQRHVIVRNLAIRESAQRVFRAGDVHEVFEELARALCHAPFNEAEVWLSHGFLGDEAGAELFPDVAISEGGYVWGWRNAGFRSGGPDCCWEVTLPVLDGSGERVGRITLRRPLGHEMPTDVQVISEILLPEVSRAVERVRVAVLGTSEAKEHVAEGEPRVPSRAEERVPELPGIIVSEHVAK